MSVILHEDPREWAAVFFHSMAQLVAKSSNIHGQTREAIVELAAADGIRLGMALAMDQPAVAQALFAEFPEAMQDFFHKEIVTFVGMLPVPDAKPHIVLGDF